ncbi:glycoside hydrolase family 15 protein [Streptomyces viridosporus]|uniref:glycoside hydrolase family 15 protein n=1 Tax=Streptomyces viridosporus TaxID=67581 RepID=UPI0034CE1513
MHRSAIILELLTYAPTGAPVAAATTGLPEQVGGERNRDYRFTWVRDSALSVRAMLDLGFVEEATGFVHWLVDRLREREGKEGEPLQTMYRLDGDPDLPEETLDHFEGCRGSSPVRMGNGAADQLQLDIYGEALYAVSQGAELAQQAGFEGWRALTRTLDWFADAWDRPDEGIWETRGGRQDFTFSRVMSWVAFGHGLRLADSFRRPADLERWRTARGAVFDQIMERGWSEKERAFVQHYDGDVLDASLLLRPPPATSRSAAQPAARPEARGCRAHDRPCTMGR